MKPELGRKGGRTFIIGEAGVNHDGKLADAKRLVEIAARANADAVKFQTFKTEEHHSSFHQPQALRAASKGYELTYDEFAELAAYCRSKNLVFLSTPFESRSVDFLDRLGVPLFKVASGEITNYPLLEHIARTGRPVLLSTGMAERQEIAGALRVLKSGYKRGRVKKPALEIAYGVMPPVTLLHCVSEYPTPYDHGNLLGMFELRGDFDLPVGLSDHSIGVEVPIAAAALGACVVEKHFTFDNTLKTADHPMSLLPDQLKDMVDSIRHVEAALGRGQRRLSSAEKTLRDVARKSIVASRPLQKGTRLSAEMLRCMRPGQGIAPPELKQLLGKTLRRDKSQDEMLTWQDVGGRVR